MKVYCCYTPAHEILLTDYFIPSLPNDVSLTAFPLEDIQGSGDFLSQEFIQCIQQKVGLILESLDQTDDAVIVWSDVDIVFFKSFRVQLLSFLWSNGLDIAFQKEGYGEWDDEVNTGFIAMRTNYRVRGFYQQVREAMRKNPELNEQPVINQLLQKAALDLNWDMLPVDFAARSHGWPPRPDLTLYHANVTEGSGGVQQKIQQFGELQVHQHHARVKVCVVSPEVLGPRRNSGIGTHAFHLIQHLKQYENTDVTLLLTAEVNVGNAQEWKEHFATQYGVKLVLIEELPPLYPLVGWFNQWFNLRSQTVYQFLHHSLFDIVYFQDLNADGFVAHQARETGLGFGKTVFTTMINGPARWAREGMKAFSQDPAYDSLLEFAESYPLGRSDIVSAPSRYAFDYVQNEARWTLADEQQLCPYMLDLPETPQSNDEQSQALQKQLIFFGRLETRKGIHLFLQALQLLEQETYFAASPPEVIFVGGHSQTPAGPSKDAIPAFFNEKLPGWQFQLHTDWDQPECIGYLRQNRNGLVVLPSIAETLGYTAIESLALGIQTIASNTGAFPEVFESDSHLFELNPRAIAGRIRAAFDGDLPAPRCRYDPVKAKQAWTQLHDACLEKLEQKKHAVSRNFPEKPLVSICIPYFNYAEYIPEQLQSLVRQSYDNYEVVIINDGSTDQASNQVFEDWKKQLEGDGRFRFFTQENRGLCHTRNRAAELARGDYLIFCDADNISEFVMTERLADAIRHSGADCVSCHFDKFRTGPDGERVQCDFYTPMGAAIEAGPYVDPFGDANFIIRKEVFLKLGGFRHVPSTASEDWEFLAELVLSGYRLEVVPLALFQYREHAESNMRISNFYDTRMRTLEPYLKRCSEPWMKKLLLHAVGSWQRGMIAAETGKTEEEPELPDEGAIEASLLERLKTCLLRLLGIRRS